MSKKIFQILTFSSFVMTIFAEEEYKANAAADTNCGIQMNLCYNPFGKTCKFLEEDSSIALCKKLWIKPTDLLNACYQGCLNDEKIGKTDKVKGCRFTSCDAAFRALRNY